MRFLTKTGADLTQNDMNDAFRASYLDAEKAYGEGDFLKAQELTIELLDELERSQPSNSTEHDAVLAWQSCVALLAGNIHLYGFSDQEKAHQCFELVLASNPQDTLKDLAEQGLERIQDRQRGVPAGLAPTATQTSTLIQDPFLTQPTSNGFTGGLDPQQTTNQASAMPWLDGPASDATNPGANQAQTRPATAPVVIDKEMANEEAKPAVAEADAEPTTPIELQANPEPDNVIEVEVVRQPEPIPEPERPPELAPALEVSPSIRQRLEQGRLQVTLPAQQKPPSELSSDSGKDSSRWSWLRNRLGRG